MLSLIVHYWDFVSSSGFLRRDTGLLFTMCSDHGTINVCYYRIAIENIITNIFWQVSLENETVSFSPPYQLRPSLVVSCKLVFIMASTVTLVWLDGDGCLVRDYSLLAC